MKGFGFLGLAILFCAVGAGQHYFFLERLLYNQTPNHAMWVLCPIWMRPSRFGGGITPKVRVNRVLGLYLQAN